MENKALLTRGIELTEREQRRLFAYGFDIYHPPHGQDVHLMRTLLKWQVREIIKKEDAWLDGQKKAKKMRCRLIWLVVAVNINALMNILWTALFIYIFAV